MRIAIIAHSFYPIRQPYAGGLEMITYQLVHDLQRRGHRVDLYAHRDSCPELNVMPMLEREDVLTKISPAEIVHSGMDEGEFVQTFLYHDVMERIAAIDYDVIHNHSLHHVPILLGNGYGKKFITTVHTPPFVQLKLGFGALPFVKQTVTAVSQRQQEIWEPVVDVDRVVYNGIDPEQWPVVHEKDDYYFWMGRICREKAPHHAIRACLNAGRRLLLAGPISNLEYYSREIEPLIKQPGIEYLGHLTHERIAPVLARARASLFTSIWEEPYGLTLAESLACGTPVLAYSIGAAPEIITSGVGRLLPVGDVPALTEALRRPVDFSAVNCRSRAENFCSAAVMTANYETLYQQLSVVQKSISYA